MRLLMPHFDKGAIREISLLAERKGVDNRKVDRIFTDAQRYATEVAKDRRGFVRIANPVVPSTDLILSVDSVRPEVYFFNAASQFYYLMDEFSLGARVDDPLSRYVVARIVKSYANFSQLGSHRNWFSPPRLPGPTSP